MLPKNDEDAMRDWLDSHRPMRQRTVKNETTKDNFNIALHRHGYNTVNKIQSKSLYSLCNDLVVGCL